MSAAHVIPGPRLCHTCQGNGKCAECDGTGVNVHLNEDEPKCRNCSGTGTCPNCQGTGRVLVHLTGMMEMGLDKL